MFVPRMGAMDQSLNPTRSRRPPSANGRVSSPSISTSLKNDGYGDGRRCRD